jgi:hypothetical protein
LGHRQKPVRDVGQEEAKIAPGKPKTEEPDNTPFDGDDPFDPFDTNEPDRPNKPKVKSGYILPDDDDEQETGSQI